MSAANVGYSWGNARIAGNGSMNEITAIEPCVQTFQGWAAIAKALWVGREHALKITGANVPMGRRCSLAFSQWAKQHGFADMREALVPRCARSFAA